MLNLWICWLIVPYHPQLMDMAVNSPLSCLINALWWLRVPYHACQDLILCVGWHWAGGPVKFPLTIQGSWHELPTRTSKQYHEGKSLKTAIDLSIKFDSPQNSFFSPKTSGTWIWRNPNSYASCITIQLMYGFYPGLKTERLVISWYLWNFSTSKIPPAHPPETKKNTKEQCL